MVAGPFSSIILALRIEQVDRRTLTFRTVSRPHLADAHTMRREMRQDRCFVVILHTQTNVIHIVGVALPARRLQSVQACRQC